jgi:branched-chain amino acid transport system permease protein
VRHREASAEDAEGPELVVVVDLAPLADADGSDAPRGIGVTGAAETTGTARWSGVASDAAGGFAGGAAARRHSWEVTRGSRQWRLLLAAASLLVLVALVAPAFVLPVLQARLLTRFVALAVALAGLQFVVGQAGQLSLCHGVYVGVGSYTTTILVGPHGWPFAPAVALAPVAGFAAGLLFGLLALRIRATYLGPVTLAVAVAFPMIAKRFTWLTGGSSGLPILRRLPAPGFLPAAKPYLWTHLVVVAVALGAFAVARNLRRSMVGLAVDAVATAPLPAAAYGIDPGRTRVMASAVGGAFGGLGGALLVLDTPIVGADSYDLFRSLGYYAAVVVGGAASLLGGVIGAALLTGVPFILATYGLKVSSNLVFGLLLLGATFAAPRGVAGSLGDWLGGLVRVREAPPPPAAGRRRGGRARARAPGEPAPARRRGHADAAGDSVAVHERPPVGVPDPLGPRRQPT